MKKYIFNKISTNIFAKVVLVVASLLLCFSAQGIWAHQAKLYLSIDKASCLPAKDHYQLKFIRRHFNDVPRDRTPHDSNKYSSEEAIRDLQKTLDIGPFLDGLEEKIYGGCQNYNTVALVKKKSAPSDAPICTGEVTSDNHDDMESGSFSERRCNFDGRRTITGSEEKNFSWTNPGYGDEWLAGTETWFCAGNGAKFDLEVSCDCEDPTPTPTPTPTPANKGGCDSVSVTKTTKFINNAQVVVNEVVVKAKNEGGIMWNSSNTEAKLYPDIKENGFGGGNGLQSNLSIPLDEATSSGQTGTFTSSFLYPITPGLYSGEFAIVVAGKEFDKRCSYSFMVASPTPNPSETNTPPPTKTNTPPPTKTNTPPPGSTPTNTPPPSNTPTPYPTIHITIVITITPSPSNTPTNTPTPTQTNTPTPTNSPTPTPTPCELRFSANETCRGAPARGAILDVSFKYGEEERQREQSAQSIIKYVCTAMSDLQVDVDHWNYAGETWTDGSCSCSKKNGFYSSCHCTVNDACTDIRGRALDECFEVPVDDIDIFYKFYGGSLGDGHTEGGLVGTTSVSCGGGYPGSEGYTTWKSTKIILGEEYRVYPLGEYGIFTSGSTTTTLDYGDPCAFVMGGVKESCRMSPLEGVTVNIKGQEAKVNKCDNYGGTPFQTKTSTNGSYYEDTKNFPLNQRFYANTPYHTWVDPDFSPNHNNNPGGSYYHVRPNSPWSHQFGTSGALVTSPARPIGVDFWSSYVFESPCLAVEGMVTDTCRPGDPISAAPGGQITLKNEDGTTVKTEQANEEGLYNIDTELEAVTGARIASNKKRLRWNDPYTVAAAPSWNNPSTGQIRDGSLLIATAIPYEPPKVGEKVYEKSYTYQKDCPLESDATHCDFIYASECIDIQGFVDESCHRERVFDGGIDFSYRDRLSGAFVKAGKRFSDESGNFAWFPEEPGDQGIRYDETWKLDLAPYGRIDLNVRPTAVAVATIVREGGGEAVDQHLTYNSPCLKVGGVVQESCRLEGASADVYLTIHDRMGTADVFQEYFTTTVGYPDYPRAGDDGGGGFNIDTDEYPFGHRFRIRYNEDYMVEVMPWSEDSEDFIRPGAEATPAFHSGQVEPALDRTTADTFSKTKKASERLDIIYQSPCIFIQGNVLESCRPSLIAPDAVKDATVEITNERHNVVSGEVDSSEGGMFYFEAFMAGDRAWHNFKRIRWGDEYSFRAKDWKDNTQVRPTATPTYAPPAPPYTGEPELVGKAYRAGIREFGTVTPAAVPTEWYAPYTYQNVDCYGEKYESFIPDEYTEKGWPTDNHCDFTYHSPCVVIAGDVYENCHSDLVESTGSTDVVHLYRSETETTPVSSEELDEDSHYINNAVSPGIRYDEDWKIDLEPWLWSERKVRPQATAVATTVSRGDCIDCDLTYYSRCLAMEGPILETCRQEEIEEGDVQVKLQKDVGGTWGDIIAISTPAETAPYFFSFDTHEYVGNENRVRWDERWQISGEPEYVTGVDRVRPKARILPVEKRPFTGDWFYDRDDEQKKLNFLPLLNPCLNICGYVREAVRWEPVITAEDENPPEPVSVTISNTYRGTSVTVDTTDDMVGIHSGIYCAPRDIEQGIRWGESYEVDANPDTKFFNNVEAELSPTVHVRPTEQAMDCMIKDPRTPEPYYIDPTDPDRTPIPYYISPDTPECNFEYQTKRQEIAGIITETCRGDPLGPINSSPTPDTVPVIIQNEEPGYETRAVTLHTMNYDHPEMGTFDFIRDYPTTELVHTEENKEYRSYYIRLGEEYSVEVPESLMLFNETAVPSPTAIKTSNEAHCGGDCDFVYDDPCYEFTGYITEMVREDGLPEVPINIINSYCYRPTPTVCPTLTTQPGPFDDVNTGSFHFTEEVCKMRRGDCFTIDAPTPGAHPSLIDITGDPPVIRDMIANVDDCGNSCSFPYENTPWALEGEVTEFVRGDILPGACVNIVNITTGTSIEADCGIDFIGCAERIAAGETLGDECKGFVHADPDGIFHYQPYDYPYQDRINTPFYAGDREDPHRFCRLRKGDEYRIEPCDRLVIPQATAITGEGPVSTHKAGYDDCGLACDIEYENAPLTVEGLIIESVRGDFLDDVCVELHNHTTDELWTICSDDEGEYVFDSTTLEPYDQRRIRTADEYSLTPLPLPTPHSTEITGPPNEYTPMVASYYDNDLECGSNCNFVYENIGMVFDATPVGNVSEQCRKDPVTGAPVIIRNETTSLRFQASPEATPFDVESITDDEGDFYYNYEDHACPLFVPTMVRDQVASLPTDHQTCYLRLRRGDIYSVIAPDDYPGKMTDGKAQPPSYASQKTYYYTLEELYEDCMHNPDDDCNFIYQNDCGSISGRLIESCYGYPVTDKSVIVDVYLRNDGQPVESVATPFASGRLDSTGYFVTNILEGGFIQGDIYDVVVRKGPTGENFNPIPIINATVTDMEHYLDNQPTPGPYPYSGRYITPPTPDPQYPVAYVEQHYLSDTLRDCGGDGACNFLFEQDPCSVYIDAPDMHTGMFAADRTAGTIQAFKPAHNRVHWTADASHTIEGVNAPIIADMGKSGRLKLPPDLLEGQEYWKNLERASNDNGEIITESAFTSRSLGRGKTFKASGIESITVGGTYQSGPGTLYADGVEVRIVNNVTFSDVYSPNCLAIIVKDANIVIDPGVERLDNLFLYSNRQVSTGGSWWSSLLTFGSMAGARVQLERYAYSEFAQYDEQLFYDFCGLAYCPEGVCDKRPIKPYQWKEEAAF